MPKREISWAAAVRRCGSSEQDCTAGAMIILAVLLVGGVLASRLGLGI